MDKTNKIITIIGLVFEGVAALVLGIFVFLWDYYLELMTLAESDMTTDEFEVMMSFMDVIYTLILVMVIVISIFFVLNLFLFTKLVRSKCSEETAKKIYLYQAIWGGLNLLSNQVTGVLYLVSGVRGYNGEREETDIREGI